MKTVFLRVYYTVVFSFERDYVSVFILQEDVLKFEGQSKGTSTD